MVGRPGSCRLLLAAPLCSQPRTPGPPLGPPALPLHPRHARPNLPALLPSLPRPAPPPSWPQQEANDDFQAGDYEWALLNYLKAAEMGQELGQSNAAWMLTEGYGYEGAAGRRRGSAQWKRGCLPGGSPRGDSGGGVGGWGWVPRGGCGAGTARGCRLRQPRPAHPSPLPSLDRPRRAGGGPGCAAAVQARGGAGQPRRPAAHRRRLLVWQGCAPRLAPRGAGARLGRAAGREAGAGCRAQPRAAAGPSPLALLAGLALPCCRLRARSLLQQQPRPPLPPPLPFRTAPRYRCTMRLASTTTRRPSSTWDSCTSLGRACPRTHTWPSASTTGGRAAVVAVFCVLHGCALSPSASLLSCAVVACHQCLSAHVPTRSPSLPDLPLPADPCCPPAAPPCCPPWRRSLAAQPEANLAVHVALAVLRLHTWWEGVEPRVPPRWAAAVTGLFSLIGGSAGWTEAWLAGGQGRGGVAGPSAGAGRQAGRQVPGSKAASTPRPPCAPLTPRCTPPCPAPPCLPPQSAAPRTPPRRHTRSRTTPAPASTACGCACGAPSPPTFFLTPWTTCLSWATTWTSRWALQAAPGTVKPV